MNDEIVDEVRRVRDEYAARFGYDIRKIVEDLRRRQQESGRTFENLPPKKPTAPRPFNKAG